jgi:hypothetical protein
MIDPTVAALAGMVVGALIVIAVLVVRGMRS